MHDLLRAYAREQAAARDYDGHSQTALARLFDYYLTAAAAAMDIVYPAAARNRPRIPRGTAAPPAMPDPAAAMAWLDAERPNLTAVIAYCAARHSWNDHATSLASTLARYCDENGRRRVTRNGYHQNREVPTGAGAVEVTGLRVSDMRAGLETGETAAEGASRHASSVSSVSPRPLLSASRK
jgi:hypothetical protein